MVLSRLLAAMIKRLTSGLIPISLAKNLIKSSVSAIDISQKALLIAKKNALLNNTKIDFFEMDILNTESLPQKFDIIVSNPPYVRELEKREIMSGSNVVGRSSQILNRRSLSTEISKKYFDVGCKMLTNAIKEFDRGSLDEINEIAYLEFEEAIAA